MPAGGEFAGRCLALAWEGRCHMAILAFEGRVENGQIRLPDDVALPEHTKVYVVIPDSHGAQQAHVR